ncbi:MAG TPA: serine/threonine-protein kinase [Polyangiaceae bacterium]|jgi:serine/threonine-protein kinase
MLEAPLELQAGDRIERYELLRPIAQGGMGSVWAAKLHGPHGFGKLVAIKTVLPRLVDDMRVRAMFLDEARLASAVVHRNVAHVLDFLDCDGALYIVMEWVEGIPLMALHERLGGRVPAGIALRVLADVCAGLHAAHELTDANGESCGIVHRDISPHNILVAAEGMAKLIDFGVAKARHRVAPESTFGQLRGRLTFMAPEQAQCEPLDRRADIWSVGAVLLYLLAGYGPFGPGADPLRALLSGASAVPPPSHIHPAIARILNGCLARRPADRFQTAEEVGWAIEDAIDEMGLSASARDVSSFVVEHGGDHLASRQWQLPMDITASSTALVSRVRRRRKGKGRLLRLAALVAAPALALGLVRVAMHAGGSSRPAAPASAPAPAITVASSEVGASGRSGAAIIEISSDPPASRPLHPHTRSRGPSRPASSKGSIR